MKIAICNEVWRDTPIESIFAKAKACGYDGVEIAPFTLAEDVREIPTARRRQIVTAARDQGLTIVGLHWLFVSPKGLHLTTPDRAVRQRTVDYLKALIEFCSDLGGRVMILGSPQQRNIEPPNTFDDGWQHARDGLAACSDLCTAQSVTVCVEALGPAETNFINTAAEAARLAHDAGPGIGIMLDYKAISTMPDGAMGTIEAFGGRARHFHANEPDGFAPGMKAGATDFAPVLSALRTSGFAGWVSVEPFDYKPDPDTVAATACRTLRAAMV
jgi:D-psicose/D-tagatose/L-ribulose 3-epimerase